LYCERRELPIEEAFPVDSRMNGLAAARLTTMRKTMAFIGLFAIAVLWVFGCTVSDDSGRIRHPLRYEIEQTSGTASHFEEVVQDHLRKVEHGGQDLALYLKKNDFQELACGEVAPSCYRLEVGSLVYTDVFVALLPRDVPTEGWRLDFVRVGFTGP
jgi:hypothetical protein